VLSNSVTWPRHQGPATPFSPAVQSLGVRALPPAGARSRQRFGLREDLAWPCRAESSFNPSPSRPRRRGIMQLMQETPCSTRERPVNALQNIEAGFASALPAGQVPRRPAADPGRLQRRRDAVTKYKGSPFSETRNYIRRCWSFMDWPPLPVSGKTRTPSTSSTTPDGRVIISDTPPSAASARWKSSGRDRACRSIVNSPELGKSVLLADPGRHLVHRPVINL